MKYSLRKILLVFGSVYTIVILAGFTLPAKKVGVNTIILDAGHGGRDPGARGWNGHWEKDIALAITLKVGYELERSMPDVKLVYTRKGDAYPSLYERSDIANSNKGDLFLSIHCNSRDAIVRSEPNGTRTEIYYAGKGKKKKKMSREVTVYKKVRYPNPARGFETYVWEPGHGAQKVDALAEAENAEIYKDPDYKNKYGGGFDINSPEFYAKAALRTKKYFQRSVKLAGHLQDEGVDAGRVEGKATRQRSKGIWVLQATAMPSILVETGYLSNPTEEAYLASESGQKEMAGIIARAVKKYKEELEKPQPNPAENQQTGKKTVIPLAEADKRELVTLKKRP